MNMNYQSMLQQLDDDQCWRPGRDDGAGPSRSGGGGVGGGGGGYRFVAPSTATRSGHGGDVTLFSPTSELLVLSSQGNEPAPSPFSWQTLFCGRWQPAAAFGGDQSEISEASAALACGERETRNGTRLRGVSELCQVVEDDGVISEVDADRSGEVRQDWTHDVNSEKENWRKFGGFIDGDVKQEETENIQEAGDHRPGDGIQSRKRYRETGLQGHPEASLNFEPSRSTSESDSDSEESGKQHKKAALSRKQKRPQGQDADGNITWTDGSVRFLFETYDAIHQRLWEESKGQVKYQKKWTPILKAMRARLGNHFTKKQCQSKYWSVRRECTEYRNTSAKAAATDPLWNPSIAGRELLKPKFYDVWLEVLGKNPEAIVSKTKSSTVKRVGYTGEILKGESSRSLHKDGQPTKQRVKDSNSAMKEMQKLMIVQLQASEKMEEAMKCRAELMMELLTQHIVHVENRVTAIYESRTPQLYMLERANHKLELILEGFAALNQNLSMLH